MEYLPTYFESEKVVEQDVIPVSPLQFDFVSKEKNLVILSNNKYESKEMAFQGNRTYIMNNQHCHQVQRRQCRRYNQKVTHLLWWSHRYHRHIPLSIDQEVLLILYFCDGHFRPLVRALATFAGRRGRLFRLTDFGCGVLDLYVNVRHFGSYG